VEAAVIGAGYRFDQRTSIEREWEPQGRNDTPVAAKNSVPHTRDRVRNLFGMTGHPLSHILARARQSLRPSVNFPLMEGLNPPR